MARLLVSDELWEIIEPLLTVKMRRSRGLGRKPIDTRKAAATAEPPRRLPLGNSRRPG